jgi:DNA-binding transcriptional MerR regulator
MMSSPDSDPYSDPIDPHRERLSIDELAAVTGVSRRTVHYYIQRRLIDPPLGRGRGRHYDRRHALQILKVRDLQRRGVSLSDMVDGVAAGAPQATPAPDAPPRRRPSSGAAISSVVRIRVDDTVTVELTAGSEVITGEFVDRLAEAVSQVIARHRGGT